jgi:hypothetical protein
LRLSASGDCQLYQSANHRRDEDNAHFDRGRIVIYQGPHGGCRCANGRTPIEKDKDATSPTVAVTRRHGQNHSQQRVLLCGNLWKIRLNEGLKALARRRF